MDCKEQFFESFNMSVEAAYDAYFRIAEKDILKGLNANEEELRRYIDNETRKWKETPQSALDGKTPGEYLDSVESFEGLIDMFRVGAIVCDDALPGIFMDKLRSYGDAATEALLGFCKDTSLLNSGEMSFMIPLMAVQVLGEWKVAAAVGVLIDMLDYECDVCDLLYEKIGLALSQIGKPAIESIINALESRDPDAPQTEYLLIALADAARQARSDEAYRCLKTAFIKMADKSIGAYCLGNYGDGRAIPALRGYIIKNRNDVSKDTFYDIIAAINKLGGNAEDLGNWDD